MQPVHLLTVIVHVYDDELTSGTKPSKLVTLKCEYLLKLHVVCVGFDGMQGGSENNFRVTNLLGFEPLVSSSS